ncbi:non-specific lipid transfer protein GPI-anchored 7-like [Nymphaea colorata]|uniref:non-specific lipid transfer protein GPI-anchored 7-like n=1 Tax=Nymphaea colorata TaxID=210225 RepID=UPI00129DEE4B|nr:non-specific lipid transfer protein GPI-anchored 7-like [Nymphaea colorata]
MEAGAGGRAMVVMTMVLVVATMTGSHRRGVGVQAQLDCPSKLVSCADPISNTSIKPGKECCSALADAVKNDLKCLCDVYNSSSIFQSLNINVTRALEVPRLCGVSGDPSRRKSGSDNKQGNGALRLTWSLKPLWALGLFWMSLIMI